MNRKLMRRVLGILTAGSLAYFLYLVHVNRQLRAELNAVSSPRASHPESPRVTSGSAAPRVSKAAGATAQSDTSSSVPQRLVDSEASRKRRLADLTLRDGLYNVYGRLFQQLALSHDEANMLEDILVDREHYVLERVIEAKASGLNLEDPQTELRVVQEASDISNAAAHTLLGDEKFQAYEHYMSTLPTRALLFPLERMLTGSTAALSADQVDTLVELMSSHPIAPQRNPIIPEEMLPQLLSVLNPEQRSAFLDYNKRLSLQRELALRYQR